MRDLQKAGRRLSSAVGVDFKNIARMGALALGVGLAASIKVGIDEMMESQAVMAQVRSGIKSTGGVAKVSAKDIVKLAESLSLKSGVDDELIAKGSSLLLTFTKVRNEAGRGNKVFNRATQAALDLSVKGFGSMDSTSKMLGKALQDPVKGMTALGRAGVTFTQAQKDQIKAMVESGNVLGAQKLILKEVETQVGGAAAAYGKTAPGAVARAKNAFAELAADLTQSVAPSVANVGERALELVQHVKEWSKTKSGQAALANVRDTVQTLGSTLATAGKVIAAIATKMVEWRAVLVPLTAGVVAMIAAHKAWAIATALLNAAKVAWAALNVVMRANPIGVITLVIVGLVAALVVAYKQSETFRDIVNGAFAAVKSVVTSTLGAIGDVITATLEFVRGLWEDHGGKVMAVVGAAWGYIKTYITSVINVVRGIVQTVTALLHGDWKGAWEGIKATLSAAWSAMKALVLGMSAPMRAAVEAIWGAIKGALPAAWEGIKGALSAAWNGLKSTITGYKDDITSAVSGIWNAIKGAIPAAWAAIKGAVVSAANALPGAITGAIDGVIEKFASVGSRAGAALANAIKSAINGIISKWNGLEFGGFSVGKGKLKVDIPSVGTPNIDLFARGGVTNRPGIFGEAGWEAAVPLGSGAQATRDRERVLRQIGLDGRSDGGLNLTMNFRSDPDPFVVSRRMAFALQTAGLVGR